MIHFLHGSPSPSGRKHPKLLNIAFARLQIEGKILEEQMSKRPLARFRSADTVSRHPMPGEIILLFIPPNPKTWREKIRMKAHGSVPCTARGCWQWVVLVLLASEVAAFAIPRSREGGLAWSQNIVGVGALLQRSTPAFRTCHVAVEYSRPPRELHSLRESGWLKRSLLLWESHRVSARGQWSRPTFALSGLRNGWEAAVAARQTISQNESKEKILETKNIAHNRDLEAAGTYYVEVVYDGYVCIRSEPNLFAVEIGVVEKGDVVQVCGRAMVSGQSWLKLKGWTDWDKKAQRWTTQENAWVCEIVSSVHLMKPAHDWHPLAAAENKLWKVQSLCEVTVRCLHASIPWTALFLIAFHMQVRSGPDFYAEAIAFKDSREILEIEEIRGDWLLLKGEIGDIHEKWVCSRAPGSGKHVLVVPLSRDDSTDEWEIVWGGGVSIRAGPSLKAPLIDGATRGDIVRARGVVSHANPQAPF